MNHCRHTSLSESQHVSYLVTRFSSPALTQPPAEAMRKKSKQQQMAQIKPSSFEVNPFPLIGSHLSLLPPWLPPWEIFCLFWISLNLPRVDKASLPRPGRLLKFHQGIETDVARSVGVMRSGGSAPGQVRGQPGPGPKPGAKPAPLGEGCSPRHFSADWVPCSGGVTLSLSCRFRCWYFCGMQSKGSLGSRESPPPSAGAGAAAARRWEPSFLPAEELSAHFQTSLILSNLWVSMKSFQFDTQSTQSGSQS